MLRKISYLFGVVFVFCFITAAKASAIQFYDLDMTGFATFSSGMKRVKTFITQRCQRKQLRGTEEQNQLPLAHNAGRTNRSGVG